jgi:hypothetical protein
MLLFMPMRKLNIQTGSCSASQTTIASIRFYAKKICTPIPLILPPFTLMPFPLLTKSRPLVSFAILSQQLVRPPPGAKMFPTERASKFSDLFSVRGRTTQIGQY